MHIVILCKLLFTHYVLTWWWPSLEERPQHVVIHLTHNTIINFVVFDLHHFISLLFTHSLAHLLSHSLAHSFTYPLTFPPKHPHTQVDIQYIINPRNCIRHGCLSEIINKTMKHSPYWKGTIVQLVKKTLRFLKFEVFYYLAHSNFRSSLYKVTSLQPRIVYGI